ENSSGLPDHATFVFGTVGMVPIAGHWDGGAVDGVGVYDPVTSTFFLRDSSGTTGTLDHVVQFGIPNHGTYIPVAGDWAGTGRTSIGLYDTANSQWLLRDTVDAVGTFVVPPFVFGTPGNKPITGDWSGTGQTS